MAGNYVLHGVMEVGSELLLKPDGKFEFMLAYGAADYWAKGTWSHDGNAVVLHSAGKRKRHSAWCAARLGSRAEFAW